MMTSDEMLNNTGIEEIIFWIQRWIETFAPDLNDNQKKQAALIRELCAGLIPAWIAWAPDNSSLLIDAIVNSKIDIRPLNALLFEAMKCRDKSGVRPPSQVLMLLAAMQLSEQADVDTATN